MASGWALVLAALAASLAAGVLIGPVALPPREVLLGLASKLPLLRVHTGLSAADLAIVWQIRAPRVVLGLLVGSMLSMAGGAYQGVFRNPLADPYLLGAAAGAGLGATLVITSGFVGSLGPIGPIQAAAFAGAMLAVGATWALARGRNRIRSTATLILAGVAVTSLLTAVQTYYQQRSDSTLRSVYSWILGSLATASWHSVALMLPWAVIGTVGVLLHLRVIDVLAVGDEEAATLGLAVERTRLTVVLSATLATAAAVSVSGLIGFVGIIVPHTVRLLVGSSNRAVIPLSIVGGGAFLVAADLFARTAIAPAEIPIGVITALIGGPFFLALLARRVSRT
ncbi:MAG TPA: iron ABC transporter permease [Actinomycetota bacterium]|nr:iron ABC transporter permease [Actinomycetota bacterium]